MCVLHRCEGDDAKNGIKRGADRVQFGRRYESRRDRAKVVSSHGMR